jgi:hypothetical protein
MAPFELGSWRIPAGVRVTSEGESLLLLSPKGEYFGLDDIGAGIWRALEHDDLAATARRMCVEYEIPVDVISADIRKLLHDLQRAGLVAPRQG